GRAEHFRVISLLCATDAASRGGVCGLGGRADHRGRGPSPPATQTRRNPAAGALTPGSLEIWPLELEWAPIRLGSGELRPASIADCQLDPRLLGTSSRRLDVGRRAMDLVGAISFFARGFCGITAAAEGQA